MKAALYARVSSDEQGKGYSLESQVDAMLKYCELNNLEPVTVLEEDYTGTKLIRPELNKVRKLIKNGQIKALVCFSSDRLTRGGAAHGQILRDELIKNRIELHFVVRGKNDDSPESEMLSGVEDVFNKYWVDKIRESAMRGRRKKIEKGIIPGHGRAAYGYRKLGKRDDTRFVIEPDEAEVVRKIFKLYTEGVGVKQIVNILNEERIPKPGKKFWGEGKIKHQVWAPENVYEILNKEIYTGVFYAQRWKMVDDKRVRTPRSEWIPIEVPAIISRQVWDEAQRRLDIGKSLSPRQNRHQYLMARRLACSCGYAVVGKPSHAKGKVYLYYHCSTMTNRHLGPCGLPGFRVRDVDAAIWKWVEDLLNDPQALLEGFKNSQQELRQQHELLYEQLADLERQIEKQKEKLSGWFAWFEESDMGAISRGLLSQKTREIEEAIATLTIERDELAEKLLGLTITDDDIATVEEYARLIREELTEVDFETMRSVVDALNLRGVLAVEDGRKVIHLSWYVQSFMLSPELVTSCSCPSRSRRC